jgi:hypothetical protein
MWRYGYHDERIRTLENHLYKARRAVVTLLPKPIRDLAESYYSIGSREDAHHWENALVECIIESATTLGRDEGVLRSPRLLSSLRLGKLWALRPGLRASRGSATALNRIWQCRCVRRVISRARLGARLLDATRREGGG